MVETENIKETVSRAASDAADTAKAELRTEAEHLKHRVADQAEDVSDAAQAASDELSGDTLMSRALDEVGYSINDIAERFRDRPVTEILDDVAVFARRNPLLFLGGAAMAGFAAARFLKAEAPTAPTDDSDPWQGHLTTEGAGQ